MTYLDSLRYRINKTTNFDLVRVSSQYTLRTHLISVFRDYEIDTVIDVGANAGQFGASLRNLGFSGEIHSFEPVNEVYDALLAATKNDSRWTAYNVALGAAPGKDIINVCRGSVFSSILSANNYGKTWELMEVAHQQEIIISTIDEFIAQLPAAKSKRLFLKMDTQGYDLKVFEGAKKSYDHIRGLMTELSLIPLYEGMPNYLEALSIYNEQGFSVSGIYPVTRRKDLALNEMDCVLVKMACFE